MDLEQLNIEIDFRYARLVALERELLETSEHINKNSDTLTTLDKDENKIALQILVQKQININKVKQDIERLERIRKRKFQL